MGKMLRGEAMEPIEYGALVLCRNNEARNAPATIANAKAADRPKWAQAYHKRYEKGDYVFAFALEDLGERDLQAIANGPIMEPLALYLPAGKVSEAEYQERLKLDYERAGIAQEPTK